MRSYTPQYYIKFVLFITLLSLSHTVQATAQNKNFGLQFGINYFNKTQKNEYTPISYLYPPTSKILFDNNGFSFRFGGLLLLSKYVSISSIYNSPRVKEYSYSFFEDKNAPYHPSAFFIKSRVTSFNTACYFHLRKFFIFTPFVGIGLVHLSLEGWFCHGNLDFKTMKIAEYENPRTNKISNQSPKDVYYYLGNKKFLGFILPIGFTVKISESLMIHGGAYYTFKKLRKWRDESSSYWGYAYKRIRDQNLSGLNIILGVYFLM